MAWTPAEFVETGPVPSTVGDPGELIMRQRALALAAGDPGTEPTSGWTAAVPVAVAYALVAVAVLVLR